jgi:hypothetical protein
MVRTTRNSAFPMIMRAQPSAALASGYFSIMGRTPVISANCRVSWESVGMPPPSPGCPFCRKVTDWGPLRLDPSALPRQPLSRSPVVRQNSVRLQFQHDTALRSTSKLRLQSRMTDTFRLLVGTMFCLFRARRSLLLECLALRQQIAAKSMFRIENNSEKGK